MDFAPWSKIRVSWATWCLRIIHTLSLWNWGKFEARGQLSNTTRHGGGGSGYTTQCEGSRNNPQHPASDAVVLWVCSGSLSCPVGLNVWASTKPHFCLPYSSEWTCTSCQGQDRTASLHFSQQRPDICTVHSLRDLAYSVLFICIFADVFLNVV